MALLGIFKNAKCSLHALSVRLLIFLYRTPVYSVQLISVSFYYRIYNTIIRVQYLQTLLQCFLKGKPIILVLSLVSVGGEYDKDKT